MNIRSCLIRFMDSDRSVKRDFAEGINRIDRKKKEDALVYAFLQCMLCGVGEQTKEEPGALELLEQEGVKDGSLWFVQDGKEYRLSRTFIKEQNASLFLIKDGAEQRLTVIPERISAGICGNMITIGQIEAVNMGNLAQRLTGRRKAGSAERDALGAIQILKMTRKGFQNQVNKRLKEEEKTQARLEDRGSILQTEIRDLQEKRMRAAEAEIQEKYSRQGALLEKELDEAWDRYQNCGRGMILSLIFTVVLTVGLTFLAVIPALIALAAGGILAAVFWMKRKNSEEQIHSLMLKQKKRKERLKKLTRRREDLEEKIADKEIEIRNGKQLLTREIKTDREQSPEEVEIEALNMAIERIEALSGKGIIPFGNQLRQHTSVFLKDLTEGTCREVLMDDEMHIRIRSGEVLLGEGEIGEDLMKKIYLSLRMAEGELIQLSGDSPFIVEEIAVCLNPETARLLEHLLEESGKQAIVCIG